MLSQEVKESTPVEEFKPIDVELLSTYKPKQFIGLLKCMNSLVEEVTLRFSETKLEVIHMDASHVAMFDAEIPDNFFETWGGISENISINLTDVLKVLGKINDKDELIIRYIKESLGDLGKLEFRLRGFKGLNRSKTVTCLDMLEEEIPKPKIFFKAKWRVILESLKYAVNDLALTSEHIEFKVNHETVTLSATSDLSNDKTVFEKNDDNTIELRTEENYVDYRSVYTVSYLTQILKPLTEVSEVVTIQLDKDMPIMIDVELPIGKLVYYVAPCIGI